MKHTPKIFTAILLALNAMPVCASDPIDVKGILTDSNGEPLEYAHIMVINNKQLEKETLSGSDGTFYLQKVPADAYLEISYQGLNLKQPVQKGTMHIQLSSKHDVENVNIQDHNCPSNAEWSDTENHCVCKDQDQEIIGGICMDKPKSSLQGPPLETQQLPNEIVLKYECEKKGSGSYWDKKENACVCKDKNQQLINGVCVDKPQRTSSLQAPQELPEKTESIPEALCKNKGKGYFWDTATSKCKHMGDIDFTDSDELIQNTDEIDVGEDVSHPTTITESDKIKACEEKGGKYSAGSCWCKTMIMNPSKAECIDGKIVKDKQSNNTNNGNSGTQEYDNSQTSENEADPEKLEKLRQAYDDARETEQSHENRLLTTGATVATGIGGMELAKGLSEQNADKTAKQSMDSYIATMRCKYGNGKQVKAGLEEIELPGGNDAQMMQLRAEYIALANDLKTRKEALGMKPGIESEKILDKSQMGLYDDENIGVTDGAYASLYRAQMYGTQKDQEQIDQTTESSKNRVIGGAVAGGVGAVGGTLGDSLINGKLNELIQSNKDK